MSLAGINHITLPAPLLEKLLGTVLENKQPSLFDVRPHEKNPFSNLFTQDKDSFEAAVDASDDGINRGKLNQVSISLSQYW